VGCADNLLGSRRAESDEIGGIDPAINICLYVVLVSLSLFATSPISEVLLAVKK
jgi:hypothetical protein